MKTNYIHDCIAITRNNGHVIESRVATRQVELLEKENSELLDMLEVCIKSLSTYGDHPIIFGQANSLIKKATS